MLYYVILYHIMLYHFISYYYRVYSGIVRLVKPPDQVAGATFMAAGGSAPEFFASLIGAHIIYNT